MSQEIKTETKEILDTIAEKIQEVNIFPKDLSYIISEYAISFYIVSSCPDKLEALTNIVYLSGADYNSGIKHIKIGKYIYNVAKDLRLYPREIGLNLKQRKNSNLKLNEIIPINFSHYDLSEISELGLLLSQIVVCDFKKEYNSIINNQEAFIKYLVDNFAGQVFGIGQHFIIISNGLPFDIEISKIVQNKKHRYSISDDFHGLLTENTKRISIKSKKQFITDI